MAKATNAQSELFNPKTFGDSGNGTSSAESSDGHLPYNSLVGPQIGPYGQEVALVNPSVALGKGKPKRTPDTLADLKQPPESPPEQEEQTDD